MPEAVPHLLHPGEMTVETLRQALSYKVSSAFAARRGRCACSISWGTFPT